MPDAATIPADARAPASAQLGFRRVILKGLAWKGASRAVFEITRLAVAVVLARLLTPHQYGLAGMVLILVAFQPVLSGTALASALVQRESLTEDDRSTVFWTNAATGLFFSLAGLALAGPVAHFYGDPHVAPLFRVMSLCFFVSSLGITHGQLLLRDMNFRALELRTMIGVVVGAGLAIGAAVRGYGAWALVVQQIATFATSTVLLWMFSPWRPHLRYSRRSLRELRSFGGNVTGTMVLYQLNENVDNVLIGRFLGASLLGAYALAYNIILVPFNRMVSPLAEVLYPVFSRIQDDRERMAQMWLRVLRVLVGLAAPAMLGLIIVAPDVVRVVFGAKWEHAVPVVQILAWVGILLALQGLDSIVLMATGRTRWLFRFALVSFAGGVTSFAIGLHWGIVGVAGCFAVVATVMQTVHLHLTARAVGAGLLTPLRALAGVLQAAVLVVAALAATRYALVSGGVAAPARLAVEVAVGLAAYVGAIAWRARDAVAELRAFARRRR